MKATISILGCMFALSGCVIDGAYLDENVSFSGTVSIPAGETYYDIGSDLTVQNGTSYDFYDLAVAEAGDISWSENLLGGDILLPEESLTIENLACGVYDLLVVDDTDTACVLSDFPLCDGDNVFTRITDYDLFGGDCD